MWRISLSDLNYDEAEENAVLQVLRSRWLTMGPRTEQFEHLVAEYVGAKHAIALANCTCALELAYEYVCAYRTFPPKTKPVVVFPDITFVATASAAVKAGAVAMPLDIEAVHKPIIRASAVKQTLDRLGSSIAAFTVMHYAGFDAQVDEVSRIASSQGIPVIEDAAHAIGGSTLGGTKLGAVGLMGCYSFFSNKNLATGEGGMIVTNDEQAATWLRLARCHGMTRVTTDRHRTKSHGYDVALIGHNYRCTEITAALGIVQFEKLEVGNQRRRLLYKQYCDAFRGTGSLRVPFSESSAQIQASACHVFPLLVRTPELRDKVRAALTEAGIQSSHHYQPVHTMSAYKEYLSRGGTGMPIPNEKALGNDWPEDAACTRNNFPFAASLHFAAREITLPMHPGLKDAEITEICDVVLKTVRS